MMVGSPVIAIQFGYQNSNYRLKSRWKLPDLPKPIRAEQLKYVEGRDSGDVQTP